MFVRFINTGIPVKRCNVSCHYCYLAQQPNRNDYTDESLKYSIEHMRNALSPERFGGKCYFNLCAAGETLLFDVLPEVTTMLLELGHFVSIVTNATPTKQLERLLNACRHIKEMLFIKCSLQYMQYVKRNLLDTFFGNVRKIREAGIAYAIELIVNDETIPLIPEIKEICMKEIGAYTHVMESRNEAIPSHPRLTKLPLKEHQEEWRSFGSKIFDYQQITYENQIKDFCYGGEYFIHLNLQTGIYNQCTLGNNLGNIFENIDEPLQFAAVGRNCTREHCWVSYVASVLCGCFNYRDTADLTYADFRDRLCSNDSRWLTQSVREAFSHRCSEFNEPYSYDKALYIDLLMRKYFKNKDPYDHESADLARIIRETFGKNGIKKVAIYDMGNLSQWLKAILQNAKIVIGCELDRIPEKSIPKVDMVIVANYHEFYKIAPDLRKKTDVPVVSILTLADGNFFEGKKKEDRANDKAISKIKAIYSHFFG